MRCTYLQVACLPRAPRSFAHDLLISTQFEGLLHKPQMLWQNPAVPSLFRDFLNVMV